MAPKPTTPMTFRAYLARRWAEGCTMGRELLAEIRLLGYAGSLTHLQRLLNTWRQTHFAATVGSPPSKAPGVINDAASQIVWPIVAAQLLCSKPRGLLTERQAEKVDMLKAAPSSPRCVSL